MNKKKGMIWIRIGLVFIAAASGLVIVNLWTTYSAGNHAQKALGSLTEIESRPQAVEVVGTEAEYPDYILNPYMDMPVRVVDGARYIGILEIPLLDLKLPVQSTWSYLNMKITPCRYEGSVYLDNMVICGHNYMTHFGALKELTLGDQLTFVDVDGNRFDYAVIGTEILQSTDVEEMSVGDWDLTLFTCTVGGATRVTVRCRRLGGQ